MEKRVFQFESKIPADVEDVLAFHKRKDALQILTMPPISVRVIRDERVDLTSGELEFQLRFGLIAINWIAEHKPGPTQYSFKDILKQGPMETWEHEHIFTSVPGGVLLTDKIKYAHKPGLAGLLTRLFFDGLPLRIFFVYRHWRTKKVLTQS